MRTFVGCALMLVLAVSATAIAQDKGKIDGKLLIGKWLPKDTKKGDAPMSLEFMKDNKMAITIESAKPEKLDGTYKLDGDKLAVKFSYDGKEKSESLTVTKLTETELETVDSGAKVDSFTRVKDDKKPVEKKPEEKKKPEDKKKP